MEPAQTESLPHLSWLINQGLAVALLLILLWAMWKGVAWCGSAFLVPLRDAAIEHLREVGQSLESLATCLKELGAETKEINARTKRIEDELGSSQIRAQRKPEASKGNF